MPKYKNFTPKLVEGFFDKMFGRIITKAGQDVVKDMTRKDPKIGKKLSRVAAMIADIRKDMKGMTPSQKDKYKRDVWKKAGVK
tara:strand:- start:155 stop:403 length:249 start_codon:yes stop_codon:yes gene_type:complete